MIESVERIVTTPLRECPPVFEYVISAGVILELAALSIEPEADDWFIVTYIGTGGTIRIPGHTPTTWLKPEDKNSPAIQAEIITQLAAAGIEFS
jgi:hypothetical protein